MHFPAQYFIWLGDAPLCGAHVKDCIVSKSSAFYNIFFPVDGGWSSWQSTAQCSVTCGGGVIKRTRTCNYPPPANGGYQCQGKSLKSEHCNTNPCPGEAAFVKLHFNVSVKALY